MKILILILTVLSFSAYSQDTIRSQKLDSLIWIKINTYRTSIGEKPCTSFETSTMRKYSKKITERNSLVKIGFHYIHPKCIFNVRSNVNLKISNCSTHGNSSSDFVTPCINQYKFESIVFLLLYNLANVN